MLRFCLFATTQILWLSAVSQLFWVDDGATPRIMSYDFTTAEITTVHDNLIAPFDLKILADDEKLVWNDTLEAVIYVSNLDGSDLEVLMQVDGLTPYYFDVDEASNRIYCSGLNSQYIFAAEYYSSSVDTILDSGGDFFSSIAFHPETNTIAVTRDDDILDRLDLENGTVNTLDIGQLAEFDPTGGDTSIGEIKATDSGDTGFYLLIGGVLHKILDEAQLEQLAFNWEDNDFFAFSSEPDQVYAGAGNIDTITRHENVLFGQASLDELFGQDFITGHSALGMDLFESDPTDITEFAEAEIHVYPNPSSDIFTILIPDLSKGKLVVTDLLGKQVFSRSFSGHRANIDLGSTASRGTYVLTILDERGQVVAIEKLVRL
jgi:hypothetical protein